DPVRDRLAIPYRIAVAGRARTVRAGADGLEAAPPVLHRRHLSADVRCGALQLRHRRGRRSRPTAVDRFLGRARAPARRGRTHDPGPGLRGGHRPHRGHTRMTRIWPSSRTITRWAARGAGFPPRSMRWPTPSVTWSRCA